MIETVDDLVERGRNFALETTLSGIGYSMKIPEWRKSGYHVKLIFLQLPSVDAALARVAQRVRQGGHDIPENTIRRRFDSGLNNFHQIYKPMVDVWLHFDNAGDTPLLIDWSEQ